MRLATALLATLALAAPASATVNRTLEPDANNLTLTWTGKPVTSVSNFFWYLADDPAGSCGAFDPTFGVQPTGQPVDAVDYCDTTLVDVPQGKLQISLPDAGDGMPNDWDLYVYTSNRRGDWGKLVGTSANTGAAESLTIPVATNYYLVNAVPVSVNGGYTGSLKYTPPKP
jgi:hypothetical protein